MEQKIKALMGLILVISAMHLCAGCHGGEVGAPTETVSGNTTSPVETTAPTQPAETRPTAVPTPTEPEETRPTVAPIPTQPAETRPTVAPIPTQPAETRPTVAPTEPEETQPVVDSTATEPIETTNPTEAETKPSAGGEDEGLPKGDLPIG